MLFNSVGYLIFLPCVFFLYYALPAAWKKPLLLAASLFFYMCWNPAYVLLILFCILSTYACGLGMAARPRRKRVMLFLVLALNLGMLIVFKYFNFFADALASLLGAAGVQAHFSALQLLLPVGISFYTFQAIGYAIDVYRGDIPPEKSLLNYALFVSFFPQLVAGPIERSRQLLGQVRENHAFRYENAAGGLWLIAVGLFKKMVVADNLATIVDAVYRQVPDGNAPAYLVATFFFAFQCYCDLAGYSDIARGSAKLFGIELMRNFDRPFISKSIAEFWRRWHISLSQWFRDYLYFPLGGSRCSIARWCLNTLIVFLISGLWHGPAWTYVLWGGSFAVYQIIGRLTRAPRAGAVRALRLDQTPRLRAALGALFTFGLIALSSAIFRSQSMADCFTIFRAIFGNLPALLSPPYWIEGLHDSPLTRNLILGGLARVGALLAFEALDAREPVWARVSKWPSPARLALYVAVIYGFFACVSFTSNEFIYFQF